MSQSVNASSSSNSNPTHNKAKNKAFNHKYNNFIKILFSSSSIGPNVRDQIIGDLSEESDNEDEAEAVTVAVTEAVAVTEIMTEAVTEAVAVTVTKAVAEAVAGQDKQEEREVNKCCKNVFRKAKGKGYRIITRFVPPYCSTVTFYSESIGFVTVSRLGADFNPNSTRISEHKSSSSRDSISTADSDQNSTCKEKDKRYYYITTGAIKTLAAAYHDTKQISQAREVSVTGTVRDPRDKEAHKKALTEYKKIMNGNNTGLKLPETIERNLIYIRLEEDDLPVGVQTIQRYNNEDEPLSTKSNIFAFIYQACLRFCHGLLYRIRILVHKLLVISNVDFHQGPAAVRNDFLFNTHDGKYAKGVRVVEGELSARLNFVGRTIAKSNLTAVNGIVAASIALFSSATTGTELNHTGLIVAGSLLIALFLWQIIWTWLVTSTTYENIAFNDFKVRKVHEAATLFGINRHYLELFLAVVSPQRSIRAHGFHNSYIDIWKTGVLEVSNSKPISSEILYHAGYVTTELQESSTIATWVPYDTHRIVYPSNDKVRKLSIVDGFIYLYSSRISAIEDMSYQQGCEGGYRTLADSMDLQAQVGERIGQLPEEVKTWQDLKIWLRKNKSKEDLRRTQFVFRCDGNYLAMPKKLYLYGNGRNFAVG